MLWNELHLGDLFISSIDPTSYLVYDIKINFEQLVISMLRFNKTTIEYHLETFVRAHDNKIGGWSIVRDGEVIFDHEVERYKGR